MTWNDQEPPASRVRRAVPWVVLSLLPPMVFWKALLLRGAFFILDAMMLNYPLRAWCAGRLLSGRFPLWCPDIACGWPIFAEGQAGVLYLPNWPIFAVLPAHFAAAYSTILHFVMAGIFMCGYLRRLGAGPQAALFGGISYQWGGFLVQRAMFLNMLNAAAWLPALFWLAERWIRRPEKRRGTAMMMTAAPAMMVLAGHPQISAYALMAWAGYLAFRVAGTGAPGSGWRLRRRLGAALPVVLILITAAGLSAVQIVPMAELSRESSRAGAIPEDLLLEGSLPPLRLAALFLPNLFGSPADSTYWGWEMGPRWELDLYTGILPLLFALMAVLAWRTAVVRFHASAAALSLFLAMGRFTLLGKLIAWLPVFSRFRIPARFGFIFAFSVAVLAGLGLDALLRSVRSSAAAAGAAPEPRRALAVFLAALGFVLVPVLVANGAGCLHPGRLLTGRHLLADLLLLLTVLAGFVLLLARIGFRRQEASRIGAGVVLLTLLDLGMNGWTTNATISPEAYERVPETVRLVRAEEDRRSGGVRAGAFRVAGLASDANTALRWHNGWQQDASGYDRYFSTLHMYGPAVFELETACFDAWSPLQLQRYRQLNRILGDRILDLLNVRYLTAAVEMTGPGYETLADEGAFLLVDNTDACPRAFFVHRAVGHSGMGSVLARLAAPGFDPREELLLEGRLPEPEGGAGRAAAEAAAAAKGADRVRITTYADREVAVAVTAGEAGHLFVSDAFYPGWTAELDGLPVPLLRANLAFRAVRVPAGRHQVVFRYRPASFVLGLWITLLSAGALLPFTVWFAGRAAGEPGRGGERPIRGEPAAWAGPPVAGSRSRVWRRWMALALLLFLLVSAAVNWNHWKSSWTELRIPLSDDREISAAQGRRAFGR